eukprot:944955-Pleurochrysis_carterae.AAC.1
MFRLRKRLVSSDLAARLVAIPNVKMWIVCYDEASATSREKDLSIAQHGQAELTNLVQVVCSSKLPSKGLYECSLIDDFFKLLAKTCS